MPLTPALAAAARRGISYEHGEVSALAPDGGGQPQAPKPAANNGPKLGRNDPCWCGSGKKFKRCHGS